MMPLMKNITKSILRKHWLNVALISCLLSACSSPSPSPKSSDARSYERVKAWQGTLDLKGLEREYSLPKGLLSAVMHQESGGKSAAVSPVGARGLFQIMPATARDLSLANAYSPQPAAVAAAQYLSQLYKRYHTDLKLTLAAYNWGMGNLDRYLQSNGKLNMPKETKNYVARVSSLRQYYN